MIQFAEAFNWVDLTILLLLVIGIARGRKRGMSEELLDVLKWLLIVVVAAYFYAPFGELMSEYTYFSLLSSYLMVYLTILLLIKVVFACFRRHIGEKLMSSDLFGRAEYYLGMCSGALRYMCVVVVVLALLNARYYSPEEIAAENMFQQNNFGSISFPTLSSIQQEALVNSLFGHAIRDYVPMLLIQATAPQARGLEQSSIVRARENTINQILDNR